MSITGIRPRRGQKDVSIDGHRRRAGGSFGWPGGIATAEWEGRRRSWIESTGISWAQESDLGLPERQKLNRCFWVRRNNLPSTTAQEA